MKPASDDSQTPHDGLGHVPTPDSSPHSSDSLPLGSSLNPSLSGSFIVPDEPPLSDSLDSSDDGAYRLSTSSGNPSESTLERPAEPHRSRAAAAAASRLASHRTPASASESSSRSAGAIELPHLDEISWYITTFVVNACLMALELVAARIMARHAGQSLYSWTAVIGVVLAGVSVGNAMGGSFADSPRRRSLLVRSLLASSVFSFAILFIDPILLRAARPDGWSWPAWIVVLASLMFLAPAVALGATNPILGRLALEGSRTPGRVLGAISAVGSLGSICGVFFTGFYLIDWFGSRSIVLIVAAVLAGAALLIARPGESLRLLIAFGWLQTMAVFGSIAVINEDVCGGMARVASRVWTWNQSSESAGRTAGAWSFAVSEAAGSLRDVGLKTGLRIDRRGEYHDESRYSYINVGSTRVEGETVQYLRLDKLYHSYYQSDRPSALHYDYERIYAAVTESLLHARDAVAAVRAPLSPFPGSNTVFDKLPQGVRWIQSTNQLEIDAYSETLAAELIRLSPDADYWAAVLDLERQFLASRRPAFASTPLAALPAGCDFGGEFMGVVRYDDTLKTLVAYEPITPAIRDRLLQMSPQHPWRNALVSARGAATPFSSLFLGGGGYVFPRWVAAHVPGCRRIDVMELDPAVTEACEQRLGLNLAQYPMMKVWHGDARQGVDELRRSLRNSDSGSPGSNDGRYDAVYGDAFNDFVVPWHLTTREFTRSIREMLQPNGVYLVNLIDVYPRTNWPGRLIPEGSVTWDRDLPEELSNDYAPIGRELRVNRDFRPLRIRRTSKQGYSLSWRQGRMPAEFEARLAALNPVSNNWKKMIAELAAQSRRPVTCSEPLPQRVQEAALGTLDLWRPLDGSFTGVEVRVATTGGWELAVRGALPAETEQRLRALPDAGPEFLRAIDDLARRSRREPCGQFLARFVHTLSREFNAVDVYSTQRDHPSDDRDTFVVAAWAGARPAASSSATPHWTAPPFARFTTSPHAPEPVVEGQMSSLLTAARSLELTDDFAPVEQLLAPVLSRQDASP